MFSLLNLVQEKATRRTGPYGAIGHAGQQRRQGAFCWLTLSPLGQSCRYFPTFRAVLVYWHQIESIWGHNDYSLINFKNEDPSIGDWHDCCLKDWGAISRRFFQIKTETPQLFELHNTTRKKFSQRTNRIKTRTCLLYTSPSPRDKRQSRMPSSA